MKRLVTRLAGNTSGAVAPTVGLSLLGLVAAGGIAFDYARLESMDTELQGAADQAALAAASQLDGSADSMTRADAAARSLLANQTLMANDNNTDGMAVTVAASTGDAGTSPVVFYDSKADAEANADAFTTADTTRATQARFVRVRVAAREAVYALTPIVGALKSGAIAAEAVAGLGSAICKVPPLMICNPAGTGTFTVSPGKGIRVVAHPAGNSGWSSGNFGYLNVGQANNGAPDQLAAMAYQDAALTCESTTSGDVDTGNTAPAIDAANTRFDLYNFASGSGSTLGQCYTGKCPAARNTTKDLIHGTSFTGNNACKVGNNGWQLQTGTGAFSPRAKQAGDTATTRLDTTITAMGLPRDNCHYTSYNSACAGGRIGDGNWARRDYFDTYHNGATPSGYQTWTRYQTYLWEIAQNNMPGANGTGVNGQYGAPKCSTGTVDPTRDRRVVTVAVASNCSSLAGSSTAVVISKWVDMFFVEPGINGRGNGAGNDELYFEEIRESTASGDGANAQVIRRDTPYLVK